MRRVPGMILVIIHCITGNISADIGQPEPIRIVGDLYNHGDISAIAFLDPLFVVGSDEGCSLQVLEPMGDGSYCGRSRLIKLLDREKELDIEAIAVDGADVYVLGSHARKRRRVDPRKGDRENLRRMSTVIFERSRHNIIKLSYHPESENFGPEIVRISLSETLERDPILGPFVNIPGKENGIDIEGVAVYDDRLYLGFRGPVLRQNYVPVMALSYGEPTNYTISFIDLGGDGIRELTRVKTGFLIIAGPQGNRDDLHKLYYWDSLRDSGRLVDNVKGLGIIPAPHGGRPEGLTVIEETDSHYKIVIVYDGVKNGNPTRFQVDKHGKTRNPLSEITQDPAVIDGRTEALSEP